MASKVAGPKSDLRGVSINDERRLNNSSSRVPNNESNGEKMDGTRRGPTGVTGPEAPERAPYKLGEPSGLSCSRFETVDSPPR